jgi:hypothetical protein
MVSIKKGEGPTLRTRKRSPLCEPIYWVVAFLISLILMEIVLFNQDNEDSPSGGSSSSSRSSHGSTIKDNLCSVASISSLSQNELHPVAGDRHMTTPPDGGKLSLMCCQTTKGNLNLLLHHKWGPLGVAHYLDMVAAGYFSLSTIPLFRCTDACQFGLSANATMTREFKHRIKDDPMWLPPGPAFRQNKAGVKRYPTGFFTYAGGGLDSRSNQFVLTLQPNQFMGGGSPWEVPMGELVGADSFVTLSKLYNGYGEKGPSQALLNKEGVSDQVREGWPLMDYMTACDLMEEMELPAATSE